MRPRDQDPPRRIVHIGPDDPRAERPGEPAPWDDDDRPSFLIEDARRRIHAEESENAREPNALARRLVIAFIAVAILAVVFHIVMPAFRLSLPPIVPMLSYAAIAAGAILTARDQPQPPDATR